MRHKETYHKLLGFFTAHFLLIKKAKKKELATSYFRTMYYLRRDDA